MRVRRLLGVVGVLMVLTGAALAQFSHQGSRLVGAGAGGAMQQGSSVALSADGTTAIVGGQGGEEDPGAAWIFTRRGGRWSRRGKLVGTGAVGRAHQGWSVALAANGKTALVGGYGDDSGVGAAWVFIRSGSAWIQQGGKLVGSGGAAPADQGISVALSADGNTAIVGGHLDHAGAGAAWVFARGGGVWTQQGGRLVSSAAAGNANQGIAVALSAAGDAALVGGPADDSGVGAAWIFRRRQGVWSEQGGKLVGTGAVGNAMQGTSVSLAADGSTALLGGTEDDTGRGAAWIFTCSGGTCMQQGSKLVGTDAVGAAHQGSSVALSADGNVAIVGGQDDHARAGASWIYTRSGGVWTQQGSKLIAAGAVGAARQGKSVSLSADGQSAIVGGPFDNAGAGAAWVITRGRRPPPRAAGPRRRP